MFFYIICTKIAFLPPAASLRRTTVPARAKENGHAKSRAFSMTADML